MAGLIAIWCLSVVVALVLRWLSRVTLRSRVAFQERDLIIGAGEVGHAVAAKIRKHQEYRI